MIQSIKKKFHQITCDHSDIESGMSGPIWITATPFYKCNKCGLVAYDLISNTRFDERKYKKLQKQWRNKLGIK